MMMLAASLMLTPFALTADADGVSWQSWTAIAYLGLIPTGINAILIITTVRRAGAGFMSTSSYASPVLAVIFGIAFFAEPLFGYQALGLVTILAGIALTQNAFARLQKLIWPRIVVTGSRDLFTPPLGLREFKGDADGSFFGPMMATATIIVTPLIVAFLVAQRRFIEGITLSGMK